MTANALVREKGGLEALNLIPLPTNTVINGMGKMI
jgi:hypothetical protein